MCLGWKLTRNELKWKNLDSPTTTCAVQQYSLLISLLMVQAAAASVSIDTHK